MSEEGGLFQRHKKWLALPLSLFPLCKKVFFQPIIKFGQENQMNFPQPRIFFCVGWFEINVFIPQRQTLKNFGDEVRGRTLNTLSF